MAPSVTSSSLSQNTPIRSWLTLYLHLFFSIVHHASSLMHFAKSHVAMKFVHAQRKLIANDRYCGPPAKQIIPSILLYNARNQSRGLPDRSDALVTRRFIGHKHRLPSCCAFFSRTLELIDGATKPVGGGRGANKFGNFFTCHPRVRWRSRKQTGDLAEGRIRPPTTRTSPKEHGNEGRGEKENQKIGKISTMRGRVTMAGETERWAPAHTRAIHRKFMYQKHKASAASLGPKQPWHPNHRQIHNRSFLSSPQSLFSSCPLPPSLSLCFVFPLFSSSTCAI